MNDNDTAIDDHWHQMAMALVDRQRTLVLATSEDNRPWTAPVYYVYIAPVFYFFSSPRSQHVEQGLANNTIAAAVFSDADQWDKIEGIQMVGRMKAVRQKLEKIRITHRYLKKFPLAGDLLTLKNPGKLDLSTKVRLYAYYPDRFFYMNNKMGFGSRIEMNF